MDGRDGESEREREERSTNTGMSVVHSLYAILVTAPTSHAEMSLSKSFALLNTGVGDGRDGESERER